MRARAVAFAPFVALLAGCPHLPAAEVLSVQGQLERDGVDGGDTTTVPFAFTGAAARGEWWPCDARLTAATCDGDRHVNVYLGLPNVTSFDALGQRGCVDADGNAAGVYETLLGRTNAGDPITLPSVLNVLVLVASDVNGDGSADLVDDEETAAASRFGRGAITVTSLGRFDGPMGLVVEGATAEGQPLTVEFQGPMSSVNTIPTLDAPRSCVAAE